MGMIEWETEVEYFEVDSSPRPIAVIRPYAELPLGWGVRQDSMIGYASTGGRDVRMRVLGFSATSPMVQAVITMPGGCEKIRKGELVGCMHPDDSDLIPGVLRTYHLAVLQEIGKNASVSLLPMPVIGLRIMPMSRKMRKLL